MLLSEPVMKSFWMSMRTRDVFLWSLVENWGGLLLVGLDCLGFGSCRHHASHSRSLPPRLSSIWMNVVRREGKGMPVPERNVLE